MGAKKKKKSLANRLARMTDEERAKYLQRRADMEEEARRRKEQLIATFMKNKLRREEGFSRLNMAKINQNWHQTLRLNKVQEMKGEVEHLRKWIDRTVTLKNRAIKKSMEELDWQENLYGRNFHAHSDHIDKIIGFHNKNLEQLHQQYQDDCTLLLHVTSKERQDFEKRSCNEIEYLKTIIHGQQAEAETLIKHNKETYIKETDEILSTYRTDLNRMRKSREKISCAIWKQICNIIKTYIEQTDRKCSHLAELRRLDTECHITIAKDLQHIQYQEMQIEKLQHEDANIKETSQEKLKNLRGTMEETSRRFLQLRQDLSRDTKHDDKQLVFLTQVSNAVIADLEQLATKGEQILLMVQTCKKFEPDFDGKTTSWTSRAVSAKALMSTDLPEVIKLTKSSSGSSSSSSSSGGGKTLLISRIIRPLTAIPRIPKTKQCLRQFRSEERSLISKPQEGNVFQISTHLIKNNPIKRKKACSTVISAAGPSTVPEESRRDSQEHMEDLLRLLNVPETGFEELNKLDRLWWIHNKVEMDCIDLKKQKRSLHEENEKLKEIMRDVLTAAALGQSIPSAKSSNTTPSRKRFVLSAPLSPFVTV